MHTVLFKSHLLAIAIVQIHIIVAALYTWSTTEIHLANQIICAGWQTHTKLLYMYPV